MNLDLEALAAAANAIVGSAVGWEMAVRIGQSLEITDALWELEWINGDGRRPRGPRQPGSAAGR